MIERILSNVVRKLEARFPADKNNGEWVWVGKGPNPFKD